MLDITPKRCESAGCNYSASFGDTTQRTRRFCARHRRRGMLSYKELVGDREWRKQGGWGVSSGVLLSCSILCDLTTRGE